MKIRVGDILQNINDEKDIKIVAKVIEYTSGNGVVGLIDREDFSRDYIPLSKLLENYKYEKNYLNKKIDKKLFGGKR